MLMRTRCPLTIGGQRGEVKHINTDTGDGGWWRSWHDNDINDNKEEGGSHPTLRTTVTGKLAERLHSVGHNRWQAEEGEGDIDDGGNNKHVTGCVHGQRQANTGNGQRWRLQRNGDNNDDVVEGGLYPTPWTTAMHEDID